MKNMMSRWRGIRDWGWLAWYMLRARARVWSLHWTYRHTIVTLSDTLQLYDHPLTLREKRQLVADGRASWLLDELR